MHPGQGRGGSSNPEILHDVLIYFLNIWSDFRHEGRGNEGGREEGGDCRE